MSYPLSWNYGYGEGTATLTASAGQIINKYARAVSFSGKNITIDTTSITTGGLGNFLTVNQYVLVHVAAYKGTGPVRPARGHWKFAYITNVTPTATNQTTLTLSKNLSNILNTPLAENLGDDGIYVQVVTVPDFKNITLDNGRSITCPQFTSTTGTGGIVAFRCSGTLTFNGGHINLAGKGMSAADAATFWSAGKIAENEPINREIGLEESGWENYRAQFHLPVNFPDGALWAVVNKMVCHNNSRIGNPSVTGVARKRDSSYDGHSSNSPRLAGGSSILLVANEIDEDTKEYLPNMIAKYSSITDSGRGLCRCYIATESNIPTDEALYSFDRINTPSRLRERCNVRLVDEAKNGEFYAGRNGWMTKQINSYAAVTYIKANRKTFTLGKMSIGEFDFEVGRLVMVHLTYNDKYSYTRENNGRFWLARITAKSTDNNGITTITIDKPAFVIGSGEEEYKDIQTWATTNDVRYLTQLITVPEFENFYMKNNRNYSTTPKFTTDIVNNIQYGYGGLFAIAVKGTCDLSANEGYTFGGWINVEDKGGAPAYGEAGLDYVGNAQMSDRLPIGAGHGSVFILTGELILDTSSRIGATYDGSRTRGMNFDTSGTYADGDSETFQDIVAQSSFTRYYGGNGGCDAGGKTTTGHNGGYGSNSTDGAAQGAHVFIVANKITNMNMSAISTGGAANSKFSSTPVSQAKVSALPGGAGYGGGGSLAPNGKYHGGNGGFIGGGGGAGTADNWAGGGGSGAFCFIYCNQSENQSDDSGIYLNN